MYSSGCATGSTSLGITGPPEQCLDPVCPTREYQGLSGQTSLLLHLSWLGSWECSWARLHALRLLPRVGSDEECPISLYSVSRRTAITVQLWPYFDGFLPQLAAFACPRCLLALQRKDRKGEGSSSRDPRKPAEWNGSEGMSQTQHAGLASWEVDESGKMCRVQEGR
jgi:hypothetical protein